MWRVIKWILAALWAVSCGIAVFILQNWISATNLPNLARLILFLSTNKFVFIPILILFGILALIAFQRDAYDKLDKIVWFYKSSSRLTPSDINPNSSWYNPYFLKRPSLDQVIKLLASGQSVLLEGVPLLGKTRFAYEALKRLPGYHVLGLIPQTQNIAEIKVPRRFFLFRPQVILFLDDLQRYIEKFPLTHLYQHLLKQSKSVAILATCRSGEEFNKIQKDQAFGSFANQNLLLISPEQLSKSEEEKLAQYFGRDWTKTAYNGTPGSIVFGLDIMRQRLISANAQAKTLMRALFLVRRSGIQTYRQNLIESVAKKVYELDSNRPAIDEAWLLLKEDGFLALEQNRVIPTHEVYLESTFYSYYEFGNDEEDTVRLWQLISAEGYRQEIFEVAFTSMIRGHKQMAEQAFRTYLELVPDDYNAQVDLGVVLIAQNRPGEAEILFRELISRAPNEVDGHYNLASILDDQGRLDEAEFEYRETIRIKPDRPEIYSSLGVLLHKNDKALEAEEAFRQAILYEPTDADNYYNLATLLAEQDRYQEAESEFREAIRIDPSLFSAHFNLGIVLGKQNKLEEAEKAFREAVRLDPTSSSAYQSLSLTLKRQKRLKEAALAYREVIRCKPNDAGVYFDLAMILYEEGEIKRAVDVLREALQINSNFAEAHHNLAIILHQQGQLSPAIIEYCEAIRCDWSNEIAHENLLAILTEQGRIKDAGQVLFHLGLTLNKKGKTEAAERTLHQAVAFDPDHAPAHFNLGAFLHKAGKLKEAEREYREAIRCKETYAEAHCNLGTVLQQLNRNEEAEKEYREAIQLNTEDFKARYNLGVLLNLQGRLEEAGNEFREADRLRTSVKPANGDILGTMVPIQPK